MLGATPFLMAAVVVLSSEAWAYPGKIAMGSTSATDSTSLEAGLSHSVTTVYESIYNQTLTRSTFSTASRIVTRSCCHGTSNVVSTPGETAPFPIHAQSPSNHPVAGQNTPNTTPTGQYSSSTSMAQSASGPLSSAQSSGHGSSASQTGSQNPTVRSDLDSRSFSTSQTSTSQTVSARTLTSKTFERTASSSGISTTIPARAAPNATSSFSLTMLSGYTLVKLSISSSIASVPSGSSLEALSNWNTSLSTSNISSTTQDSSMTTSANMSSNNSLPIPSFDSSNRLFSTTLSSVRTATAPPSRHSSLGQPTSSNSSSSNSGPLLPATINSTSIQFNSTPTTSTTLAGFVTSNATLATGAAAPNILVSSLLVASAAPVAVVAAAVSASRIAASETAIAANCNDGSWDLTVANYLKANTDANLKTWWLGGSDNESGVTFPAKSAPGTFLTEALAASFEPVGSQLVCTLESHSCQPADGCTSEFTEALRSICELLTLSADYAVHIPQGVTQTGPASFFHSIGPASHYGWFAIHSIANIFAFSETFTVENLFICLR